MVAPCRLNTSTATAGTKDSSSTDGEPEGEHHDQIVGPGDVAEGERDRTHVVLAHVDGHGEPPPAVDEGGVGVAYALRIRRRARRVIDPAHLVGATVPPEAGQGQGAAWWGHRREGGRSRSR